MSDDRFWDRALSRRSWLGVTGATLAGASLGACTTSHRISIKVPSGLLVTTETPRPPITDPNPALERLLAGNRRFVAGQMRHPDQDPGRRLKVSGDQDPYAVIVCCSDSRLSPEMLFDEGLGDLFVVRVAGNIVDEDGWVAGSIEYAVDHLETPLVMVIGHQRCGAVSATLESIQHHSTPRGSIAALVTAITPAVAVAEQRQGDLVDNTVRANAELARDAITKSAELTSRLRAGQLKVVAAYYSLDDGKVSLI
jgi:carbonic anhydrase